MKKNLKLFGAFFRIGLFLFGGGYSMLPLLRREVVDKNGWATQEEILDYFVIGQCTPGIIAVNTATFVGHKKNGVPGAVSATLGIIFPSLVIITIIAALFENFARFDVVRHAFVGIRAATGALITAAVIRLIKSGVRSVRALLLCLASFAAVAVFGGSPVVVVIAAALIGVVFGFRRRGE